MTNRTSILRSIPQHTDLDALRATPREELLDAVFFALADPVRRRILERLGDESLLVTELAAPFDISLQAVSKHIQVLVRAGLVSQERSGRISRCSIEVAPIFEAAVWMNRYSHYWQAQFDALVGWLDETTNTSSKNTSSTNTSSKPKVRRATAKPGQRRKT